MSLSGARLPRENRRDLFFSAAVKAVIDMRVAASPLDYQALLHQFSQCAFDSGHVALDVLRQEPPLDNSIDGVLRVGVLR